MYSAHPPCDTRIVWRLVTVLAVLVALFSTSSAFSQSGPPNIDFFLGGNSGNINQVSVSPDGTFFVTCSQDGTAKVWNLALGLPQAILSNGAGYAMINAVPAQDSNTVYTISFNQTLGTSYLTRWSATTGTIIVSRALPFQPGLIALSSDGKTLAVTQATSNPQIIYLFDANKLTQVRRLAGANGITTCLAFSPRIATALATGDSNPNVTVWNTATGSQTALGYIANPALTIAFSPTNADALLVGTGYNCFSGSISKQSLTANFRCDLGGGGNAAAFSPDQSKLAVIGSSRVITIFNVPSGTQFSQTPYPTPGYSSVAFEPDNQNFIVASNQNVGEYNTIGGSITDDFNLFHTALTSIVTAPGDVFATGSSEGVWSFSADVPPSFNRIAASGFTPNAPLCYSQDGTLLACYGKNSSNNNAISVVNVANNQPEPNTIPVTAYAAAIPTGGPGLLVYDGAKVNTFSLPDGGLLNQVSVAALGTGGGAAMTPDGTSIALYTSGTVSIYKTSNGARTARCVVAVGSRGPGTTVAGAVGISADGTVASLVNTGGIYVFNALTGAVLGAFPAPTGITYTGAAALATLGDSVAAARSDGGLDIYRVFGGVHTYYTRQIGTGISALKFSSDDSLLYAATIDGGLAVAYNPYPVGLVSLALSSTEVEGPIGTSLGTVTLNLAQKTATTVQLAVSDPTAVSVPLNVVVPAGATTASFTLTSRAVTKATPVTVSATYLGVTRNVVVTVEPAIKVVALTLTSSNVVGGYGTLATVQLASKSSNAGATVALACTNPYVVLPPTVFVAPNKKNAIFWIQTTTTTVVQNATISATHGGVTLSAPLTIVPARVSTLTLLPATIAGGDDSIGVITLTAAAPTDTVVTLSSSDSKTAAPDVISVTIPAGRMHGYFTISSLQVKTQKTVQINATANDTSAQAILTVTL